MADGRWQMADGRWQMADGRWRAAQRERDDDDMMAVMERPTAR
jgi:hypothetical protein